MATQIRWIVGALLVLALLVSPALAQRQPAAPAQPLRGQQIQGQIPQAQPAQARTTLRPQQGQTEESLTDHQIATWLVLGNELEVHLAKLALQHAHDKNVKQFAEMMSQQHGNLINQLRQFAPDAPMLGGEQRADQPAAQQSETKTEQPSARPTQLARGQAGLPIFAVCYQMAQRELNSLRQELSRKQSSEFDKAYIGTQIHEHMAMLNTLEVLRPYASLQLQNQIDQAIPATQQHLVQAKKIGEQLWGGAGDQIQTGKREGGDDQETRRDQ